MSVVSQVTRLRRAERAARKVAQDQMRRDGSRRDSLYHGLATLCEEQGTDRVLLCLATVLGDRAEATGSERYELAAADVLRAYERRAK